MNFTHQTESYGSDLTFNVSKGSQLSFHLCSFTIAYDKTLQLLEHPWEHPWGYLKKHDGAYNVQNGQGHMTETFWPGN